MVVQSVILTALSVFFPKLAPLLTQPMSAILPAFELFEDSPDRGANLYWRGAILAPRTV